MRPRIRVLLDVSDEADLAEKRFGTNHDLGPVEWFAILGEEFGEVGKEVTKWLPPRERAPDPVNYRTELVQLAATAVRAIEAIDAAELITRSEQLPPT